MRRQCDTGVNASPLSNCMYRHRIYRVATRESSAKIEVVIVGKGDLARLARSRQSGISTLNVDCGGFGFRHLCLPVQVQTRSLMETREWREDEKCKKRGPRNRVEGVQACSRFYVYTQPERPHVEISNWEELHQRWPAGLTRSMCEISSA